MIDCVSALTQNLTGACSLPPDYTIILVVLVVGMGILIYALSWLLASRNVKGGMLD